MLGLELGHGELLLPDQLHIGGHVCEDLGVPQAPDLLHTGHHPVLFPGDMGEELPAIGELIHGLSEGDGGPLPFAALASPLEDLADAPGIIGASVPRLTFGADAAVHPGGPLQPFRHGQVRVQGEGVVGAAIDLHGDAVDDLHLDATAGVAVEADGVEHVLGLGQRVELLLAQLSGFGLGDELLGEAHIGGGEGAAASGGTEIHEPAAGHPLLGWGQLPSHGAPPDSGSRCSRPGAWCPCWPSGTGSCWP